MAELEIKKVDFYDSELIGVQEAATGKVFTAINNVLKGIGFDDRQIEHQRNKWKEDEAVSKGVQKIFVPLRRWHARSILYRHYETSSCIG